MASSSGCVWQFDDRHSSYSKISTVHFLFLLDTIQSVIVFDDAFYWFVYHFNDFSSFGHFNLSLIDGPFLDSIIMFTVQIVYCWRIWRLGNWRVIPAVTAFASFFWCWSQDSDINLSVDRLRSCRVPVGCLPGFMWVYSFLHYLSWLTSLRVSL